MNKGRLFAPGGGSHHEDACTAAELLRKETAALFTGTLDRALDDRITDLTVVDAIDRVAGIDGAARDLRRSLEQIDRSGA